MRIELTVNGRRRETDAWAGESLLFALRERLGLPGSKNACEQGECGSCSVLLDGVLVCSCLVLAAQADGHDVVTVEGLHAAGDRRREFGHAHAALLGRHLLELGELHRQRVAAGPVIATVSVGSPNRFRRSRMVVSTNSL